MTKEAEAQLLTIDSFEEFEAGNGTSDFHLEEGSYDGAVVVGYQIVESEYEGKKKTQTKLIWQLTDNDGVVHTIRGSGWTISANEKSKMRIELQKWFDTTDWKKVCDILTKGNILIKHEDGGAHFDMSGFIGKRGKLLIAEKTSKKGAKYAVIMSISKTKNKEAFEFGEVPWFMTEGDDVIAFKLAEGVKIRPKKEGEAGDIAEGAAPAQAFGATNPPQAAAMPAVDPTLKVQQPAPQPAPAVPAAEQAPDQGDDMEDDLPF